MTENDHLEDLRGDLLEHASALSMMAEGHLSDLTTLAAALDGSNGLEGDLSGAVERITLAKKDIYLKIITAYAAVMQGLLGSRKDEAEEPALDKLRAAVAGLIQGRDLSTPEAVREVIQCLRIDRKTAQTLVEQVQAEGRS